MSNRLLNLVWGARPFGPPRVGPSMRLVLAALADQVNEAKDGDSCYPSLETIQERTEMGRRTVIRALAALRREKWLRVETRCGYGSVYYFDIQRLTASQRPTRQVRLQGTRALAAPVPLEQGSGALKVGEGCLERLPNIEEPAVKPEEESAAAQPVEKILVFDPEYQLTPPAKPKLVKGGSKAEKAKDASFVLPDWIPEELWRDYLAICSKPGKAIKPETLAAKVRKLEKLRNHGSDPSAVLERSIERGWVGLFEIPIDERGPRVHSGKATPQLSTVERARLQRQQRVTA